MRKGYWNLCFSVRKRSIFQGATLLAVQFCGTYPLYEKTISASHKNLQQNRGFFEGFNRGGRSKTHSFSGCGFLVRLTFTGMSCPWWRYRLTQMCRFVLSRFKAFLQNAVFTLSPILFLHHDEKKLRNGPTEKSGALPHANVVLARPTWSKLHAKLSIPGKICLLYVSGVLERILT